MAWTTPRDWTTGELVDMSIMDTHVRDNFLAVLHPLALSGTTVDVVNTATETSLGSFTVPGNSMGANGLIETVMTGDFVYNNSNTNTLRVRCKFGGTTVIDFTYSTTNATITGTSKPWKWTFTITNRASTGSQYAILETSNTANTSFQKLGDITVTTGIITGGASGDAALVANTSAIDTTADRLVDVTVQWSAAASTNSWRRYLLHGQVAKV